MYDVLSQLSYLWEVKEQKVRGELKSPDTGASHKERGCHFYGGS